MTLRTSRWTLVTGIVIVIVLIALQLWGRDPGNWWGLVGRIGAVIAEFGIVIAEVVAWLRRPGRPGFALAPHGFGVRSRIPPVLWALFILSTLSLSAGTSVDAWSFFTANRDNRLVAIAPIVGTALVVLVAAVVTVAAIRLAWRGYLVELTPAGVRTASILHRRMIPWEALAPDVYPSPQRLRLVVASPDLVVQRGWNALLGSRQAPTVPVDVHLSFVAAAIRWYVEHPGDRAAIGTAAEDDRLIAAFAAAAPPIPPPYASSPYASSPYASSPYGPASPTDAAPPLATLAPVTDKPTALRVAVALAYVTAAVAVLSAAANLAITFIFRDRLLAAQAAIAAQNPDPPADGTLLFDTNTLAFVRASDAVVLGIVALGALIAVVLAWAVSRRSDGARIGLVTVSALGAVVACCPCLWPWFSLEIVPEAGVFLNSWIVVQFGVIGALTVLNALVLALLLNPTVAAYTRGPRPYALSRWPSYGE